MLKKDAPLEWIQNEQQDIYSMVFRFKDKESPRSYIASIVHDLHVRSFNLQIFESLPTIHFRITHWKKY